MIQLLGSQEGREAEAARSLRDLIVASWPWIEKDQDAVVSIIAGVKCHGQRRRDIDIVLLGTFVYPVKFTPFLDISWGSGTPFRPKEAFVESLCVTIEVKEQDPSGVNFTGGGRVDVRYVRDNTETWSSATDQSEDQKYSLKNYLEHHSLAAPYISNLIWLKNVLNKQLPSRPHNLLGGNSTWELFLNVIFQLDRTRNQANEWLVSARRGSGAPFRPVIDLLTRNLRPTGLDRTKMDRVTHAALRDEWVETVGKQQFILRGRGGSGKTVLMLQLAWRLYETVGGRILLLTYNRALAADIRRMLTLLGVPDDIGDRHIQIQTVYSYFYALLKALGVVSANEDDFLSCYEERKTEALAMLRGGTLTSQDLADLRAKQPQMFRWDDIFIDEAQDWPEDERDLLRFFCKPERLVVADGIDQLVRGAECDWTAGLAAGVSKTVFLPTCLRMKAGLAEFSNAVANALGLASWKVTAHPDAPGGRVIIIEGDYFTEATLHFEIVGASNSAGNQPVDLLGCVPPSLVERDDGGRAVRSMPGERLRAWGGDVWDGVKVDARTGYAVSPTEFRVLQYDSSRGLEGWAVFLWGLDDFFEYKVREWHRINAGSSVGDPDRQASLFAVRWLMIPLSRAIDTLVIQVGKRASAFKSTLRQVADSCQDFVEWRSTGSA